MPAVKAKKKLAPKKVALKLKKPVAVPVLTLQEQRWKKLLATVDACHKLDTEGGNYAQSAYCVAVLRDVENYDDDEEADNRILPESVKRYVVTGTRSSHNDDESRVLDADDLQTLRAEILEFYLDGDSDSWTVNEVLDLDTGETIKWELTVLITPNIPDDNAVI